MVCLTANIAQMWKFLKTRKQAEVQTIKNLPQSQSNKHHHHLESGQNAHPMVKMWREEAAMPELSVMFVSVKETMQTLLGVMNACAVTILGA